MKFETLLGKTLTEVLVSRYTDGGDDDRIEFTCSDGSVYSMAHVQDCCESVDIEDICGDLDALIGAPLLLAQEVSNSGEKDGDPPIPLPRNENEPEDMFDTDNCWSRTWTFYTLATVDATVTIRWFGSSSGYYSERVDFCKVDGT